MLNLLNAKNYEDTKLENKYFQFRCFHMNSNTLTHWHNHTEIIYISKGISFVYVNGKLFLCNEGDILFIPRESLHSILPKSNSNYCAIVIGDTLFTSMLSDIRCKTILQAFLLNTQLKPIHINNSKIFYKKLVSIINTIIEEDKAKNNYYQMVVKAELCKFFTILLRNLPLQSSLEFTQKDSHIYLIKKTLDYISMHYKEKITLTSISKYINISKQHFCRIFKEYTGKTFIEYLTVYRLEQAQLLLKTTNLPISQIPELTGFCNENYFSRIYKKKYGHPPSYIRKNN